MTKGFIFVINQTNGFNVRLAVALYSLRKYCKLPVTIIVSKDQVNHKQIGDICAAFDASLLPMSEDTRQVAKKKRANSLILKTRARDWAPYDLTIFIDADTHFAGDMSPLFGLIEEHGFVVTEMCNPPWVVSGGKSRKRIEPWIKHGLFEQPPPDAKSINSGVFGFKKDHPIWDEWYDKTEQGIKLFGGTHYFDEYTLNLLAIKHDAKFVSSSYNAYGRYHKDPTGIICWHHAGSKHFRKEWIKDGKNVILSSQLWCETFDEAQAIHPDLFASLDVDGKTKEYIRSKKEPMKFPFEFSKLAPSIDELEWLHKELTKIKAKSVLEFGCGITSWVINDALKPTSYLAIEDFEPYAQPNIDNVKKHSPNIDVQNTWDAFEKKQFDFIFVDSSAGCGMKGLHREKTIEGCIEAGSIGENTIIGLHDWNKRSGKKPRQMLEKDGWQLITSTKSGTGIGLYRPPIAPQIKFEKNPEIGSEYHKNLDNITITTAADAKHIDRLLISLPTWVEVKGITCPILVFFHGLPLDDKKLNPLKKYDNVKFIAWDLPAAESQRERMLASFVLGSAQYVKTEFTAKLDSDTIAVNDDPWIKDEFFEFDMVGQKWGYTKPAHWVPKIDYWLDGLDKIGAIKNFKGCLGYNKYIKKYDGDPKRPERQKFKERRVISWLRITRTKVLQEVASNIHVGRLPMPSEDTLIWRWCERLDLKWGRHDFKAHGWRHTKNPAEIAQEAIKTYANPNNNLTTETAGQSVEQGTGSLPAAAPAV